MSLKAQCYILVIIPKLDRRGLRENLYPFHLMSIYLIMRGVGGDDGLKQGIPLGDLGGTVHVRRWPQECHLGVHMKPAENCKSSLINRVSLKNYIDINRRSIQTL